MLFSKNLPETIIIVQNISLQDLLILLMKELFGVTKDQMEGWEQGILLL